VRDVLQHLPMEFMAETQKLIGISLEGSVGWQRGAEIAALPVVLVARCAACRRRWPGAAIGRT